MIVKRNLNVVQIIWSGKMYQSMILKLKRNKIIKNLFILLLLNVCCSISVFAQKQKTTQELLMSAKWEPQDFYHEDNCGFVRYTEVKFITEMKFYGKYRFFSYDYYLSSSPDSVFDRNKIGKNCNGKYIIEDGGDYVFISEILELTSTKLVVRNLTPGFTTTGKVTTYLPTNMKF